MSQKCLSNDFRKSNLCSLSPDNLFLLGVTIFPAKENKRSDGTDVATIQR